MTAGTTPEALLGEAAWLRRLALTLAGDADDADDLVQESWIAAWRRDPETSRPLRPWLGKVLRDRSRMRRRAEARRAAREAAVAGGEDAPAPAEVLDQVRLHRVLVDLVLALDEPYRATVLARYVEGLSSAAVARRLAVPEGTVRWRLHEALTRLRAGLDEREGARKAWAPAVLAFATKGLDVAKTTKAGLGVIALLLLLLGAAGVWRVTHRRGAPAPAPITAGAAPTAPHAAARATDDALALMASRRPPGWFAQEGVAPRRIAGIVLVDGAPAAGARVRLEDEASRAALVGAREVVTGADGRFDFGDQRATRYDLGAYLPGRVATVEPIELRDPRVRSDHVVVVLEPCVIGLYGRVLDPAGGPIAHAQLLAQGVVGGESDGQGAYDICLAADGAAPDARRLVVRAAAYGALELIAPLAGRVRHDLVLTPEATLAGRVVDARGQPVAMASVRITGDEAAPRPGSEQPATARAATGPDGRFELSGLAAGRLRVQARARGAASAVAMIEVGVGATTSLTLTVEARGVLRGHVTAGGQPVAGVAVFDRAELPTYRARSQVAAPIDEAVSQADGSFVLDGVALGTRSLGTSPDRLRGPLTVEVAAGEQTVELEVEAMGTIAGTVRRHGQPISHALVQARAITAWTSTRTTATDADGRYAFDDLEADDYQLNAHGPAVGAFVNTDERVRIAPGGRAEVDLDLRWGARISGRVVGEDGAPVAGAIVGFQSTTTDDLSRCTTGADGGFRCDTMTGGAAYRVEVAASDTSPRPFGFAGTAPAPFVLRDGDDHLDDVVLAVVVSHVEIRGVVVDPAGAPVADARVTADAGRDAWAAVPTAVTDQRGAFALRELAPGAYRVQVAGADGGRARVDGVAAGAAELRIVLAPPSCDDGQVLHAAPAATGQRPSGRIAWGASLELLGWDAPARVKRGDTFELTVYYRVLAPLDRSWKIFVHVEGGRGRINADHDPLGGRCPTSTWRPGDVIVDRTPVRVDAAFSPGPYAVWIGFFGGVAPDWRNLEVTAAPDGLRDPHQRLKLTTVEIVD